MDLSSRLRNLANSLARAEFEARTPGRYLLVTVTPASDDAFSFDTAVGSQAKLLQAAADAHQRRIFALEKTDRSPYSNISLGRARNCDVVLREPSVSKLHAHFVVNAGNWKLVDRSSANGTFINGEKLDPGKAAPLAPGDQILFGLVSCQFADAAVLFRELGPE